MRWKNVQLDRASLRVVESVEQTKAGLRFKAPKTEQARAITLSAFAVDELRKLKLDTPRSLSRLTFTPTSSARSRTRTRTRLDLAFGPAIRRVSLASKRSAAASVATGFWPILPKLLSPAIAMVWKGGRVV